MVFRQRTAPGALALQLSRLLGVARATVPMGQRQVTPLALRATRALEDLNNQQVGLGEMANEGPATALKNGWFNGGLMLI